MKKAVKAKEAMKSLPKTHSKLVDDLNSENEVNYDLIDFAKSHKDEFRLMLYNVQQLAKALFRLQVLKGIETLDTAYEKIKNIEDKILKEQLQIL